MKNIKPEIDITNIPKDPEKSTEYDFDINEYDTDSASLEFDEDLTEKVIGYIEKEIRGSFEYKKYINYLKSESLYP
jgi:hypothetical protein